MRVLLLAWALAVFPAHGAGVGVAAEAVPPLALRDTHDA